MTAPLPVRLIVTGHEAGRAVFTSDERVTPRTMTMLPGIETYELWSIDGARSLPDRVGRPEVPRYFPETDGTVVRVVTFPPDTESVGRADFDVAAALAEMEEKMPGAMTHFEPDNPGMHTTDSIDFGICLAGELVLELDDGAEQTVTPGTVVVQRGTRHGWRNRTDEPAMMAFILLGADRADT